jgi:hypothetical protein
MTTTTTLHCVTTLNRAVAALQSGSRGLAARLLEQFRQELAEELEVFRQAAFNEGRLDTLVKVQSARKDAPDGQP